MANKDDLRISVVSGGLKLHCTAVLDAIDDAAKYAGQLTDAQDSLTDLAWGRVLFGLGDTGQATLTVDATAKTISCLAGAALFANYTVGRDVQLTNFTNGGNNQTTEITAVADDSITIGNATGLVNETDNNARAQESPKPDESDQVTAVNAVKDRLTELKDALDNTAVTTADRRDDLNDWVW